MINNIIGLHKILYPEEYATIFIYAYPTFNGELEMLIAKSGYMKEFKTKYYKSLRFLEQLKKNCIMQPKLFELLVNLESIYSLKLKGEKNIRILFDFQAVDGKEIAILYHCFQEKRTKDYSEEIIVAKARRKEIASL